MTRIVSIDIGGTHARFALADVAEGRVLALHAPVTLETGKYAALQTAWEEFGRRCPEPLPRDVAIAFAGPIMGDVLKLTNNPWIIRPALICEKLSVARYTLVNDFAAVAHAVAQADDGQFQHLCGPATPFMTTGVLSVIGPGTGLGVAYVVRAATGYHVIATEGGHIDFAPLDNIEDALLARLRSRYRRVSAERVASGPGLVDIYEALAALEGRAIQSFDDRTLWTAALTGEDKLAVAAADRFCMALGSIAGDIALAQGAQGVVIAGGLGLRLADVLLRSGFADRFRAKGRFEAMMDAIPVKLITHPQPGLFGAAAAFAREHSV